MSDEKLLMDKLEVLCRAWIECDPNRAGNPPGSGYHADDPMPPTENTVTLDEDGNITGVSVVGVSEEWQRRPRWQWFTPRAVALEEYLESHGYVIVRADQVKQP